MKKREVTDAMVERAQKACPALIHRDVARHMLDAALNPPQEPEVVVTEEMEQVGRQTALNCRMSVTGPGSIRAIYRAMRRLEPKAANEASQRFIYCRSISKSTHFGDGYAMCPSCETPHQRTGPKDRREGWNGKTWHLELRGKIKGVRRSGDGK